MKKLKAIIQSPLSVKLLIFIYAYSLYRNGSLLFRPEVTNKLGFWSLFISPVVTIVCLTLIFFGAWWAWIVGIGECIYCAGVSIYVLSRGSQILSITTASALNDQSPSKLTPDQLTWGMNIGLYGGLTIVIVSAVGTAFLWYLARTYFETNHRRTYPAE